MSQTGWDWGIAIDWSNYFGKKFMITAQLSSTPTTTQHDVMFAQKKDSQMVQNQLFL